MTYFSEGVAPRGEVRVARGGELPAGTLAKGISVSALFGEALNLSVVVLDAGAVADVHTHEEEQLGCVVSGTLAFTDGTTTWTLEPGDLYHAPPGAPHGAHAPEGRCVVLDAFSPPRAGLRALLGNEG